MSLQQLLDRQALKDLVDTFSNLADEKKVAEQMALFTPNAQVNTYINGELAFEMAGKTQIEQVFTDYLAPFDRVYHLNGQQTVTFSDDSHATAIVYCQVVLVKQDNGKNVMLSHYVRYEDSYIKTDANWLIDNRVAKFLISEERVMGE